MARHRSDDIGLYTAYLADLAKLSTLRTLEDDLQEQRPLKPFTVETGFLTEDDRKRIKFRYTPLTLVDRIIPLASALLFLSSCISDWSRNRSSVKTKPEASNPSRF